MLFLRVKLLLRTDWLLLEPLLVVGPVPPVMQLVNCFRGRPSDMMESITPGAALCRRASSIPDNTLSNASKNLLDRQKHETRSIYNTAAIFIILKVSTRGSSTPLSPSRPVSYHTRSWDSPESCDPFKHSGCCRKRRYPNAEHIQPGRCAASGPAYLEHTPVTGQAPALMRL